VERTVADLNFLPPHDVCVRRRAANLGYRSISLALEIQKILSELFALL
jgi:hypothetical protein